MMKNVANRRKHQHLFKEPARQDPYRTQLKPGGAVQCPNCKSISVQGRWVLSSEFKSNSPEALITGELNCPACRQLQDRFAMGVVELHGETWKKKDRLVMNT